MFLFPTFSQALSQNSGYRITESMITTQCKKCGETFTCDALVKTPHPDRVDYSCPTDGTDLGGTYAADGGGVVVGMSNGYLIAPPEEKLPDR